MFTRTIQLIGEEGFAALQRARAILFGVGGVGGWCAETLLRTGLGHLTIVDFDKVDTTNLNRQIVATAANIGQNKVQEMQKRLLQICPEADVQIIDRQYNRETADSFDLSQYDIVVDAIDMVECKALLLYRATQAGCRVYSSMGAGRKTDTQKIRTAEFWKVQGCPLARALRTRMKKAGLMPASKIQCVYSEEISGEKGTIAPVVGVFGMTLASMVINDLTLEEIAAERKRLEALSYWNDNRQSLEKLAPCISILQDHQFAKSEAIIDGYNCELHMLLSNNELLGILCVLPHYGPGMGGGIESLISQYIKSEFKHFFTHEETYALVKRFNVDSYEEAFDWYKNVLDNFMQLDEATK